MSNLVTKIEVQKNNKDRVNIFVNEEFFIACDMSLVYLQGIKKGEEIDKEKLNNIVLEDNFIKAKSRSLRYLGKSYKTEKEVRKKLEECEYNEEVINRVIEFLKEYDFINDNRYTELFIKEKLKKHGKNKIKYDLKLKGVEEKLINEKIDCLDEGKELNIAYEIASKKYNQLVRCEKDKLKIRKKLNDFLLRRGYDFSTVHILLKKVMEEGE